MKYLGLFWCFRSIK